MSEQNEDLPFFLVCEAVYPGRQSLRSFALGNNLSAPAGRHWGEPLEQSPNTQDIIRHPSSINPAIRLV